MPYLGCFIVPGEFDGENVPSSPLASLFIHEIIQYSMLGLLVLYRPQDVPGSQSAYPRNPNPNLVNDSPQWRKYRGTFFWLVPGFVNNSRGGAKQTV